MYISILMHVCTLLNIFKYEYSCKRHMFIFNRKMRMFCYRWIRIWRVCIICMYYMVIRFCMNWLNCSYHRSSHLHPQVVKWKTSMCWGSLKRMAIFYIAAPATFPNGSLLKTVCCSVMQCDAVWCSVVYCDAVWLGLTSCGAVWCSVLQYGAVWSCAIQCVAVYGSVLQCVALCCWVLGKDTARIEWEMLYGKDECFYRSVMKRVAVCCSVLGQDTARREWERMCGKNECFDTYHSYLSYPNTPQPHLASSTSWKAGASSWVLG